jgi:predicted XRE-type DNA-binding protein
MQNTSMAGVPMNCINWLALGAVVYSVMDKRNALKVLGVKEQINADVLQPLIDRGLSQRKIAEELEVSQSLIRNICKKLGIKTKRGRKQ